MRAVVVLVLVNIIPPYVAAEDAIVAHLESLRSQFEELRQDLNHPQRRVDRQYEDRLKELVQVAKSGADLDLLDAINEEMRIFRNRKTLSEFSDMPELADVQKAYVDRSNKLTTERSEQEVELLKAYFEKLQSFGDDLAGAGDEKSANLVQTEILRLRGTVQVIPVEGGGQRIKWLLDGDGNPPAFYGDLSVMTYPWKSGKPRFTPMQHFGDELFVLGGVGGNLAGKGEYASFSRTERNGPFGLMAYSRQWSFWARAYSLRDRRLMLHTASVQVAQADRAKPKVRLIHRSRGFCYLSGIWGYFGADTSCKVEINSADGFYYLTGNFDNDSVGAQAISVQYPPGSAPGFRLSSADWRRGMPMQELVRADEGICLLSAIGGAFRGGGEFVQLKIDDEGKWVLGGNSLQPNTSASAFILRFP